MEQTIVGRPKCRIFKPHGSARLGKKPTQIIWPKRQPESNFSGCEGFVAYVKKMDVKQVLILGWSGNDDSHIKPYLEDLSDSDVRIIHVGLPHHTNASVATVGWGVVDEYILDFKGGGIDVLYGLAKGVGLDSPCIVDKDPLASLFKNLLMMKLKRKPIPIK